MKRTIAFLIACTLLGAQPTHAQVLPREFKGGVHKITSGGVFGVTIGMKREKAYEILSKRWATRFDGTHACRPEPYEGEDCPGEEKDDYRVAGGLLSGNIELYIHNGKVAQIVWWRDPFDP